MDFLLLEKLQGFINILQAVDSHAPLSGFWLRVAEEKKKNFVEIIEQSTQIKRKGGSNFKWAKQADAR